LYLGGLSAVGLEQALSKLVLLSFLGIEGSDLLFGQARRLLGRWFPLVPLRRRGLRSVGIWNLNYIVTARTLQVL
jgi:hypothetical protein